MVIYYVGWILVLHFSFVSFPVHVPHALDDFAGSAPAKVREERVRCAICFFGLPRSYKTMVLPSIQKNILRPNQRHNCDIFVHYFFQTKDASGRFNDGGKIDPTEIHLLEAAVKEGSHNLPSHGNQRKASPVVVFTNDTEDQFFRKRKNSLWRYHNSYNSHGRQIYFPWKDKTWDKGSLDNVVRQWHSIDAVFQLMEQHAQRYNINYTRVAMLRNDVMYLTPIDIMMTDNATVDTSNRHFVVPPFGSSPVNDRMIHGPYEGVKIWATQRFNMIEDRVQLEGDDSGYGMHSERFVNSSIMPAMEKLGYSKHVDPDICFVRTRADSVALITDCVLRGETQGIRQKNITTMVEHIIGRKCVDVEDDDWTGVMEYLNC